MKLLENGVLLDPEGDAPEPGSLLVDGDRIVARLGPGDPGPEHAERVDLSGVRIAPGFLDLHDHGELIFADPGDLRDALVRAAASSLRHGTTGFLATTVAWPPERLRDFVTQFGSIMTQWSEAGAEPLGLHLEGPWINGEAAGAQPSDGIRAFDPSEGEDLLARGGGLIRMVTLAPEVEGSDALLDALRRRGVVASLGHSVAGEAEIDRAADRGMTHVTHLFNAMGPIHQREPGVPGRVLTDDRLSCDLICDGVHVHPRMVRLAARAVTDRLVLITDRIEPPERARAEGFGSGPVRDDGEALRLADGRLAGSTLRLDRAIRNACAFGAASLLEAVAACTVRPARVLGIEAERGTLRPGSRADLAILDETGDVAETWVGGQRVWSAQPG